MTAEEARALALSLPEAVEQDHHGRPSFRVDGKIFATLWSAGRMNVMVDEGGVRAAIDAAPDACEEVWWGKRLDQQVECLGAELQARSPAQRDALQQRQIHVLVTGSLQDVAARIAEGSERGHRERRGVEPLIRARIVQPALPATFGRSFAPKPSDERPVLLLSTSGSSATVNGRPLCIWTMPLIVKSSGRS